MEEKMRAYFTRRPSSIEAVMNNAERAKTDGMLPTEVNPIARVELEPEQYAAFCRTPMKDWDFLSAHADMSMYRTDEADCIIIECPNMISLAVCCDGYAYGRYVGCLVSPFDLMVFVNRIRHFFETCFEEHNSPLLSW
jgi:hypothetical protein